MSQAMIETDCIKLKGKKNAEKIFKSRYVLQEKTIIVLKDCRLRNCMYHARNAIVTKLTIIIFCVEICNKKYIVNWF